MPFFRKRNGGLEMRKEVLMEPGFAGQIVEIIKSTRSIDEMTEN